MKAQGKNIKYHNSLSNEDFMKLYSSDMLSKECPLGFLTRLIFDIALVMSWHHGTLYNMDIYDLKLSKQRDVGVY